MARPRPTPPMPPTLSTPTEFARPLDFETQATGPREAARMFIGCEGPAGKTRVVTPDPE